MEIGTNPDEGERFLFLYFDPLDNINHYELKRELPSSANLYACLALVGLSGFLIATYPSSINVRIIFRFSSFVVPKSSLLFKSLADKVPVLKRHNKSIVPNTKSRTLFLERDLLHTWTNICTSICPSCVLLTITD